MYAALAVGQLLGPDGLIGKVKHMHPDGCVAASVLNVGADFVFGSRYYLQGLVVPAVGAVAA
jgi:hypothetical protein